MSVLTRVIPCLDVKNGRVVKGINFVNLQDAGDPVECAKLYDEQGADELCFLDIGASHEQRRPIIDTIKKVADVVFIPLLVGGGVQSTKEVKDMLMAGADRISINSHAIRKPSIISDIANKYGSQCLVVAIDAKKEKDGSFHAYTKGGREDSGLDAIKWAKQVCELGAGEILLTSMDRDGTRLGFDLELLAEMRKAVRVPIIASGGVGSAQHLAEGAKTGADAVLAASIFHQREITIHNAKKIMQQAGVSVRL